MTGLEKYEVWLDKGNEVLNLRKEGDDRLWVSKDEALAKARQLLAEEKAERGDEPKEAPEGLREEIKRLSQSNEFYQTWAVHKLVRVERDGETIYKSMVGDRYIVENTTRHPVAEQKAPAGLVEELRALQKEIYALKIKERDGLANPETELNDRYHLGLSAGGGIASDRLKEVIASYRPAEAKADEGLREALEAVCQTHLYKMDNSFRQGAQAMYDSFAKRRPTPDRTEELVKRLREWQARPDRDDIRAWIEFNEILSDFEKEKNI
jgi:hypothetical protein